MEKPEPGSVPAGGIGPDEPSNEYLVPSVPHDLLKRHLERLVTRLELGGRNPTQKRVHDVRVAARRLRVLLQALTPLSGDKKMLERFKDSIEKILDGTDRLSDLNVALRTIRTHGGRYVAARRIASRKRAEITKLRTEAALFLQAFLESERDGIEGIFRLFSGVTPPAESAVFQMELASEAARFERAVRKRSGCEPADPAGLHSLRISLRKLRYVIEFSRPYFGERVGDAVAEAKKLQTYLGDLHDLDITIEMLGNIHTAETGRLVAALSRARERHAAAFAEMKPGLDNVRLDTSRDRKPKAGEDEAAGSRLVMMRHGTAVKSGTEGIEPDGLRPLVRKGRSEVRRIARRLCKTGVAPDRIISSQALRALQTAMIVSEETGFGGEIEFMDELAPGAPPKEAAEAVLKRLEPGMTVLIAGHEPQFGALLSYFISGSGSPLPMAKGGAAVIRFAGEPGRGAGRMVMMLQPGFDEKPGKAREAERRADNGGQVTGDIQD